MKRLFSQRNLIKGNLFLLLGVCLCIYFSFHALQGQRSLTKLVSVEYQITQQEEQLQGLQSERKALQRRVLMMRPDTLNADLLEERVRHVLGYKHADEWVVESRS